jgi:hypothetical protein
VREGDRVARAHPDAASAAQLVDRPRDDPKPHAVELAEERGDLARQRTIHKGLEQDGFGAVLALVHGDQLAEDRIRAFAAWTPSLDPADQSLRPPTQRRVDETLLRRCMQIDRAWSDVGASRHFGNPEVGVAAARDLAQGGRLDRARCSGGPARSFTLYVPSIRYKPSVSEW